MSVSYLFPYLLPLFAVIIHVCSVPQSPNNSEHLLGTGPELGLAETVVGSTGLLSQECTTSGTGWDLGRGRGAL